MHRLGWMKRFVWTLSIVTIGWQAAEGQVALLEGFDFQSRQYLLLIFPTGYGAPRDGSGITYIDDASVLDRMQQDLVFDEAPPQFRSRCEDDLVLHVCSQGQSREMIGIDIRCRAITGSKGHYLYDGLLNLQSAKPARQQIDHFQDLASARIARDSIAHLPKLIYLAPPAWTRFEGQFVFYKEKDRHRTAEVAEQLQHQLQAAYPDQPFEIEVTSAGGSSELGCDYHCSVTCNRALFQQFRLYPPSYGGWEAFPLEMVSYWRE
jgi:hypothetical protein